MSGLIYEVGQGYPQVEIEVIQGDDGLKRRGQCWGASFTTLP